MKRKIINAVIASVMTIIILGVSFNVKVTRKVTDENGKENIITKSVSYREKHMDDTAGFHKTFSFSFNI